ncbi:hypothetical protein [Variovorax guangxiensis]|uniref:hypothetical protein n=1 Tax=Variovorax guangxiensis TaxID=1775474 RepID=UPI00285F496D|nr:hypothetical protein [Variovorax guangxiensis]MDR6853777.1 hypothetical protein [Variovorax guangxiensis]
MTIEFIAPWLLPSVLSAITIAAIVLGRSRHRHAWLLDLSAQAGWNVYIVAASAWGFLPLSATLTVLYWHDRLGSKRKDDRESEARDEWKDTVMDALVTSAAFRKEHENDPEKALTALVKMKTCMALDPAISIEAEALVQRGRDEVNGKSDITVSPPAHLLQAFGQLKPLPETTAKPIRSASVHRREIGIEWEDTGVPGIEVTEVASSAPAPWNTLAAA